MMIDVKFSNTFKSLFLLLVLLILSWPPQLWGQEDAGALFTEIEPQQRSGVNAEPALMRARFVGVNFKQLRESTLTLNLFADVVLQAERLGISQANGLRRVWRGRISGQPNSTVTLVSSKVAEILVGSVVLGTGDAYQIRFAGDGAHVVRQVDPSLYPAEAEPEPVSIPNPPKALSLSEIHQGGSATIDLLVVYTPAVRNAEGGTAATEAFIDLLVNETNQAYANSGITQRIRLVHSAEVAYTETGDLRTDRNRLQATDDGHLDQVHTLRDSHGADVVTLLVESGGNFCGIAFIMVDVNAGFADFAFNVTRRDCAAAPQYTFPHELGHIMSARHDWFADDTAFSPFSFNHGYVDADENQRWRTIMALNSHCASLGRVCPRIPNLSNPEVFHNVDRPTGIPAGSSTNCTAGNAESNGCDADNAMTLNQTANVVASFRNIGPPDAPPVARFDVVCDDLSCAFDASASSDDNGITAYSWNFGDGNTATGVVTSHGYADSGTFEVTLTVTDTTGQTGTRSEMVTVDETCDDTTRPTVTLTAPVSGQRVWNVTDLRANANDNVGVTQVRFRINGNTVCTDHSPPWHCTTNVNNFPTGNYAFSARAFDACGNSRTSANVTARIVSNPELVIDGPAGGASVSGEDVPIFGWASDPDGVSSVAITFDGQAMVPPVYGGPRPDVCAQVPLDDPNCPNVGYGTTFNSTHYGNGPHAIEVVATDSTGKTSVATRQFVIDNPEPDLCTPGPKTLCLRNGRFKAEVTNVNGGASSDAYARPYSDIGGFFWFFGPNNLEVGVKVLGPASNGFWWVYHGGATNREYTLAVTDTQTGEVRTYVKPFGSFCGDGDTQAFPAGSPAMAKISGLLPATGLPAAAMNGSCTGSSTALCLQDDRFKVEVLRSGVPQPAHPLTPDTGTFSFFSPDSAEVFVKVLDGTGSNGHYWVFYGAQTDRDYTVQVTDTMTGETVTYDNTLGHNCGNGDTTAF